MFLRTQKQLLARIQVSLAGLVAEEIWYGQTTSGPSSDLVNATRNAAAYVGVYGMGRSLISAAASGPGPYGEMDPIGVVLADAERRKEIDAILNDCRDRVRNLLLKKRHVVEGVRDALLEREELVGDEIEVLMAELGEREPIEVPVATATATGRRSASGGRRAARRRQRPRRPAPRPIRRLRRGRSARRRRGRRYACLTVRLYDSLTRELHDVSPVDGETVKIYSCGPTVYRYIHIGNMRSFMLGDLIRRALRFEGFTVRWIMNITDVGHMTDEVSDTGRDKMELAEADEGLSAAEIAQKYTDAFLLDSDLVGIERADLYPRATDHIDDMIKIIQTLIEKGHAYEVDGTVYYDVTSFPGYGKLSGNTLDQLRAGHRQEVAVDPAKRHPRTSRCGRRPAPTARSNGRARGATATPDGTSSARRCR